MNTLKHTIIGASTALALQASVLAHNTQNEVQDVLNDNECPQTVVLHFAETDARLQEFKVFETCSASLEIFPTEHPNIVEFRVNGKPQYMLYPLVDNAAV